MHNRRNQGSFHLTDPRAIRTRTALATALVDLAAERDVAHLSIRDIVARAGVGYATFFRHFRDKEDLILAVADKLTEALLPALMPALSNNDTAAAAETLCRYVDANRGAYRTLLSAGGEGPLRARLVEQAVERGMNVELPAAPGLPRDLAATHSVRALLGLLEWWLGEGGDYGVAEFAAVVDRLVLSPVRKG